MGLGTLVMLAAAKAKAANPYMPLWEHVPDGEPRIFEDPDNPGKKRVYVYGSHDTKQANYCGRDVRAWSAPVEDVYKRQVLYRDYRPARRSVKCGALF